LVFQSSRKGSLLRRGGENAQGGVSSLRKSWSHLHGIYLKGNQVPICVTLRPLQKGESVYLPRNGSLIREKTHFFRRKGSSY